MIDPTKYTSVLQCYIVTNPHFLSAGSGGDK